MTADDARAINETEWDLLEALWEAETATAGEVADALTTSRGWAYSTVKTMLDRMVGKGLVEARRVGNVYEYRAAVAPTDARRSAWKRFVRAAFGDSLEPALRFIAEDARLTRTQRDALRRMLEDSE